MSVVSAEQYYVIPLSVQKDGNDYMVGNAEIGEFYQFPEQGVKIIDMLKSGFSTPAIQARLQEEYQETVDVDGFVEQLTSIGFVHPEDQKLNVQARLEAVAHDSRRTFNVDPRIAKAIFSPPVLLCYLAVITYTGFAAINEPALRINFSAFYVETWRTPFLLLVLTLALVHVAWHEMGHMLAAARHGIKSKYGISNRLWMIVAESDLTGILTLPRAQRYFPMLAGVMVDVLWASLLTILIKVLLRSNASPFAVQLIQALVLDIVISIRWQFDVFVKTDLYFVVCNYFRHPDLDRDARAYLRDLLHRVTFGRYGTVAPGSFQSLNAVRVFSTIWLFGRALSFLVFFGVFLPTMAKYVISAAQLAMGGPRSVWIVMDAFGYVAIMLMMIGAGMFVWIKKMIAPSYKGEGS
jgi:putative peptide zinc metalloprotease protein